MTEQANAPYTVSALYRRFPVSPVLHADLTTWDPDGAQIHVHVRGIRASTMHRSMEHIANMAVADAAFGRIVRGTTQTGDHELSIMAMASKEMLRGRLLRFSIQKENENKPAGSWS